MTISFSKGLKNYILCNGSLKQILHGGVINVYGGTVPTDADASIGGATLLYQIVDLSGARGGETLSSGSATYSGYAGSVDTLTVNGVNVIPGGSIQVGAGSVSDMAAAVANAIYARVSSPDYSGAAASGSGIATIKAMPGTGTGPNGFVVSGTISQNVTLGSLSGGVNGVSNVDATCTFTASGTSGDVRQCSENWHGMYQTDSTLVPFNGTLAQTMIDYAAKINAYHPLYDCTASPSGANLTITAPPGLGAQYNGVYFYIYTSAYGGIPATGNLTMTGSSIGAAIFAGGVSAVTALGASCSFTVGSTAFTQLSTLTVNGVGVINAAVPWNTNATTTAADIAASINLKTSVPEYTATSVGATVTITASTTGTASNGFAVVATFTPALSVAYANMAGGAVALPINYALVVQATGTITLTGGASGSINTVTVGGLNIIDAPVAFNTSLTQTASDLVEAINNNRSTPEYMASSSGAVITIKLIPPYGTAANGTVVSATFTTITATFTNLASGAYNANGIMSGDVIDGVLHKHPTQQLHASPASGATVSSNQATFFRYIATTGDTGQADTTENFCRVQGTVTDETGSGDMKLLRNSYVKEDSVILTDLIFSI